MLIKIKTLSQRRWLQLPCGLFLLSSCFPAEKISPVVKIFYYFFSYHDLLYKELLLTWKLMYHLFLVIKLKLSIQMSYECQQDSVNRYNIYVSHNTPDMFLLSKSQSRLLFTFWWHTRTRLIAELYLLSTLVYMSGCLYKVESIFPSKVHEIPVGFWKGLCCSVTSFLVYCRLLLVCLGFFFYISILLLVSFRLMNLIVYLAIFVLF